MLRITWFDWALKNWLILPLAVPLFWGELFTLNHTSRELDDGVSSGGSSDSRILLWFCSSSKLSPWKNRMPLGQAGQDTPRGHRLLGKPHSLIVKSHLIAVLRSSSGQMF